MKAEKIDYFYQLVVKSPDGTIMILDTFEDKEQAIHAVKFCNDKPSSLMKALIIFASHIELQEVRTIDLSIEEPE